MNTDPIKRRPIVRTGNRRSVFYAWPQMMLICLLGCGSNPHIAPADGVVRVGDVVAEAGRVVFRPLAGGPTAIGKIDREGKFVMQIADIGNGAPVGSHHVLVVDVPQRGTNKTLAFRASEHVRLQVEPSHENHFEIVISPPDWTVIDD